MASWLCCGGYYRTTLLREVTPAVVEDEAARLLAGGISHDFKNLLGVILRNAELLLESKPSEKQQRHAEQIKKAAQTRQLLQPQTGFISHRPLPEYGGRRHRKAPAAPDR
jgi:signal transduction histidine kinase